ncbi:MAG: hypothetical protein II837_01070, partial [Treponema sp.]|nr:hypothetical protein [Treponema sp.]
AGEAELLDEAEDEDGILAGPEDFSEPEEPAEAEDEVESLADADAEAFAEAEAVDVDVLPESEEDAAGDVLEPEEEEAEELPEPEELELEPDDMEAGEETGGEPEQELPQAEGDIEEPDVIEEPAEAEETEEADPSIEDFLNDQEDELSMELSEIEEAITDRSTAEQYKQTADMFRQLRSLADSLPADRKALFMQGEDRLQLEWVISRLEGKPGLLAVAEAWRKDFDLERPFSEPEAAKDMHGLPLVKFVLDYMKNSIGSLDDVYLAACLGNKVEGLLSKLGE